MPDEGNTRPGEGTPSAVPPSVTASSGPDGIPPAPEKGPPTLKSLLHQWLYQRFGTWGLLTLALVSLTFFVWWNWDKVSTLPLVSQLVEVLSRKSLPSAPAGKFTVAVARLENDKGREYEHLIRESLDEYEGIEVIEVDRDVMSEQTVSDQRFKEGEARAQKYLEKTGADVLIWGTVIRVGGQSTPKLFLTDSRGMKRKHSGRYAPETQNLNLPSLFWDELKEVLRLRVLTQSTELQAAQGRYVADKLEPFVEKVRLLLESQEGQGWSVETRASMRVILANALVLMGAQSGERQELVEAAAEYRAALAERPRAREPQEWAQTQYSLGVALATLGERERDTARLEEAVVAFRLALEERTREREPLEWAMTQARLAWVQARLGERERGTARLKEAVATFRAALKELIRENDPLEWAQTKTRLGLVLTELGMREGRMERLEEAVAAHHDALEELTQESVPLHWARAQLNLGWTLMNLGARERGTARLEEAVMAYRAALKELTQERTPLDWAMTQSSLGATLAALGAREEGTARLEEAVVAYREALEEWTRVNAPLYWAATQLSLGAALTTLGEREGSVPRLEDAVAAHREALKELTRKRVPLQWAQTQNSLGLALAALGEREGNAAHLEAAVAAHRAALKEFTRERMALDWARAQNGLGSALWELGEHRQSSALRCEALHSQTLAWEVFSEAGAYEAMEVAQDVRRESALLRDQPGPRGLEGCVRTHKRLAEQLATLERWKGDAAPGSSVARRGSRRAR